MAIRIVDIKREHCPAARLIGKRYTDNPNWGEWWANGLFEPLEAMQALSFNGDAYIGAVHIVNGMPEYWVGMLFSTDSEVPDGYESALIGPMDFAVCYLCDHENSGAFYTMDTHNLCLNALRDCGLRRREDDWCLERYNCPRFTSPNEDGEVILDYAVAIE